VSDAEVAGDAPAAAKGSCVYTNPFSRMEECREYLGPSWNSGSMATDCRRAMGVFSDGAACDYPESLGTCLLNGDRVNATRLVFPGSDAAQCDATRNGCTVFGGGEFTPAGPCTGSGGGGMTGGFGVFQPPVLECRAPIAGEPAGMSEGGQVCTWSSISGATEEGRRYQDYASCDRVRTQRPYYPVDPAPARATPDARLEDPAYVSELGWVRSQVASSACVCCHSSEVAPSGPSNWYLEAPGNWMDSFHDTGLALGAGWIDSTALGAYPAADNNGFARTTSGIPTTDPARMAAFFEAELTARGRTRADFASARPFGGPIYDQLVYTPTACTDGDGVTADGTITWGGGGARYVYVLDAGSANPGVPPNLDLPTGTRWRVDVPFEAAPIESGIVYGSLPAGTTQRIPSSGAPEALVPGTEYYLYVLADVGIPIARCLFTYPN